VLARKEELCFKCHGPLIKGATGPEGEHLPVKEGKCYACHASHASDYPRQLTGEVGGLCEGCHKKVKAAADVSRYAHAPVSEGKCKACHLPHGGKMDLALPMSIKGLCLTCHKDLESALKEKGAFVHRAVEECGKCHSGHSSERPALLRADGRDLCKACHEKRTDERFVKAHGGVAVEGSDCLSCHEPHASADKRLLNRVLHPPFEKEACKKCHQKL
jgi:predicted CXXCH cytochrome family protein